MKRVLRDSKAPVKAAYDLDFFGDIENRAYHAGYDLQADTDGNITLTARDADYKLPEITVRKIDGERTTYEAHMKFQELDTSNEQYYDSMEFYVGHWLEAAKFVTYLQQWSPDDYIDDEE